MLMISHRGNISSIQPVRENSPSYIDEAIIAGYDVEMDVRLINGCLVLGHDTPDYQISLEWILERKHNLFVHTKNFGALSFLINKDLRTFFHQKEEHTIINHCNLIWSHNLVEANENSIIPLLSRNDIENFEIKNVYGICSDFVAELAAKNE
jgi:hypothetical protein